MSVTVSRPGSFGTVASRRLSHVQDALLVCVSAAFFVSHARYALDTGSLTNVFFAIEQGLLAAMFLTRRRSQFTSTRVFDWVVAFASWLPLAMRPLETHGTAASTGSVIQMVGLTLVIVSFATLGRSFGVVAANRGLKIGGPYRLVRHPIYFSHSVTLLGVVIANFNWINLTIALVATSCQFFRMDAEERVLAATSDYATYKERVRYRLIPGLY